MALQGGMVMLTFQVGQRLCGVGPGEASPDQRTESPEPKETSVTAKTKTGAAPAERGASAMAILETAERLFGENGLESVSIRDIAKEARVSIAVIYHHYGSKANLLQTILRVRLTEIVEIRRPMLERLEAQERPDVRDVLRALFAPVAYWRSRASGRQSSRQFLSRALVSTLPEITSGMDGSIQYLKEIVRLFERALPHLSHAEVCWRFHFTMGLENMNHWDVARLALLSDGECDGDSVEETLERAVAYAAAAFLAPPFDGPFRPNQDPELR